MWDIDAIKSLVSSALRVRASMPVRSLPSAVITPVMLSAMLLLMTWLICFWYSLIWSGSASINKGAVIVPRRAVAEMAPTVLLSEPYSSNRVGPEMKVLTLIRWPMCLGVSERFICVGSTVFDLRVCWVKIICSLSLKLLIGADELHIRPICFFIKG